MKIIKEGKTELSIFPIRVECKRCHSVVDYYQEDLDIEAYPSYNMGDDQTRSYFVNAQCPCCCFNNARRLSVSNKGYDLEEA